MSQSRQKKLLFGIGNILNGDDGVGCYVAQTLRSDDWITIDCATAPENFSGQVNRYSPSEVFVVDAALMGLNPGSVRLIDSSKIQEVGFSTHTISLAYFISYLTEECTSVTLIGIEPLDTSLGLPLSEPVKCGADQLIQILKSDVVDSIKSL